MTEVAILHLNFFQRIVRGKFSTGLDLPGVFSKEEVRFSMEKIFMGNSPSYTELKRTFLSYQTIRGKEL